MTQDTDTIVPVAPIEVVAARERPDRRVEETVFDVRDLGVFYGQDPRSRDVNLEIYRNMVTALIGPSGCGKSTFIRCLNRMNDLVPGARVDGRDPLPRPGSLRLRRRRRRGAPPDRDGLPEAEPVPEVDLRQRRLRAAHARHAARASTSASSAR